MTIEPTSAPGATFNFSVRFGASLLFNVKSRDPLTLALVAVGLALVALLASYLPARRATRVDPVVSLRYE